jgi:hypothetical protein
MILIKKFIKNYFNEENSLKEIFLSNKRNILLFKRNYVKIHFLNILTIKDLNLNREFLSK